MVTKNDRSHNKCSWPEDQVNEKIERLLTDLKFPEDKRKQISHSIFLYLRSQTLTDFFGLEDETFRMTLKETLRSRETKRLFFIDILGAHAWANPLFHNYLYEQIRAYMERNRTDIWNLEVQDSDLDRLLRKKMEERFAQHIDIDEVMPDYDSGGPIDLEMVRILSWEVSDMMSDVAQDIIDLHRVFNIPLLYVPRDTLGLALRKRTEKVEFHLALDKNDEPLHNSSGSSPQEHWKRSCWIYTRGKRMPYFEKALRIPPKDVIEYILTSESCIFAAEKMRQL